MRLLYFKCYIWVRNIQKMNKILLAFILAPVLSFAQNLTSKTYYDWSADVWIEKTRENFNSQGINNLTEVWDTALNNWKNQYQTTATYDDTNRITLSKTDRWINSWRNSSQMVYSYNPDQTVTKLYQLWNSNQWNNIHLYTYTYNQGILIEESTSDWNENDWVIQRRAFYHYNTNGSINNIVIQQPHFSTGELTDFQRFVYTYTATNKMASYTLESRWNNAWFGINRILYAYDSNDYLVNEAAQGWMGESFETQWQLNHTNDSSGNFLQTIRQEYDTDNQIWVNEQKIVYTYQTLNMSSFSKDGLFRFGPNPVKDQLEIMLEPIGSNATVKITDTTGKTILETAVVAQDQIDVRHFPSGIYFLRLQLNDQTSVKKFIKQ